MSISHANIIDAEVSNHGSIVLFTPLTELASEWIQENVEEGALWHGRSLAVEHRCAPDILQGMMAAGLNVEAY